MATYTDINNVQDGVYSGTNGGASVGVIQTGGDDNTFNIDGLSGATFVGSSNAGASNSVTETLTYEFDRTINGVQFRTSRDNIGEEFAIYVNGVKVPADLSFLDDPTYWTVNQDDNFQSTQPVNSRADLASLFTAHTWTITMPSGIDTFSIEAVQSTGLGSAFDLSIDTDPFMGVICFGMGTFIKTITGEVLVEDLKVGDSVSTLDHGYQKIRWIGSKKLNSTDVERSEKLRPIRILKGALGKNIPNKDMLVSKQHRVLIRSNISRRIFGEKEILVPATKLVGIEGIDVVEQCAEGIEYFHILFDEHQIIWANGALAESLLIGEMALMTMSNEAISEIGELFPQLISRVKKITPARYTPKKGVDIKRLIRKRQGKALYRCAF